jgi:cytochrome c peroxidase
MPQIGPGKGNNSTGYSDGREDFGREAVTGDATDRFKFRTPTLRNVALTFPYGHAGAYNSLEAVVKHHLDPINSLYQYDASQLVLPSRADLDAQDLVVMNDTWRVTEIAKHNELDPIELKDKDVEALISFLHSLTDLSSLDLRFNTPKYVPSGLSLVE